MGCDLFVCKTNSYSKTTTTNEASIFLYLKQFKFVAFKKNLSLHDFVRCLRNLRTSRPKLCIIFFFSKKSKKMSLAPLFPSPLTDLSWIIGPIFTVSPTESLCAKITLKYMDCIEAYGLHKGRDKCAELFFDWSECQNSIFQHYRSNAIRAERMRQYRAGKIDKPFDEYPPIDSYLFMC